MASRLATGIALTALAFSLFVMAMPWRTVVTHGEEAGVITGNDLAFGVELPASLMPEAARRHSEGSAALTELENVLSEPGPVLWLVYVFALLSSVAALLSWRRPPTSRVRLLNIAALCAVVVALASPAHSLLIIDGWPEFHHAHHRIMDRFAAMGLVSVADAHEFLSTLMFIGSGWSYGCAAGGVVASASCAIAARSVGQEPTTA